MSMMGIPYVIEEGAGKEERVYDLYSRLLKDRIIFIGSEFTDSLANSIIAQLLFLEADDDKKDIVIYINSLGGDVYACLAIYDVMNYIKADVSTLCIGNACSAGAFILAAGQKGKRFALKNSQIMLHQMTAGVGGNIKDMRIHMKQMDHVNESLLKEWAKNTNHSVQELKKDIDRDYFMSAKEAIEYGVIDKVLVR